MLEGTFGLALLAGILAAINPCGFALLPAYISLLVAGEQDGAAAGAAGAAGWRTAAVGRALVLTAAMAVGFVAVFGSFGLLAASAADALSRQLPWLTVVIGLVLVGLGGWLLAGRSLPALPAKLTRGPAVTRRFGSMAMFGAAYAVASLSCTFVQFLLVVVIAGFRQGSLLSGVGHLLAYAGGMTLLVGSVAVTVALARMSFVRGLRRAIPWLTRGGGGLLVLAGAYVAWYGVYELRVFADGSAEDPVVDTASRVQFAVESWLVGLGPAPVVAGLAGLLGIVVAVVLLLARRRRRRDDATLVDM